MTRARVVSLVPSATETLVALGIRPVGCTRFCDADGIPTVGGTKNVDVDAVLALGPDLVVVNDEENRIEDADTLTAAGLELHSMSPRSVGDVGPAVRALARALDTPVPEPFDDWDAWCARTAVPVRMSAFVPIWRRPWMSLAGDTYGSSVLAHAGIANVMGGPAHPVGTTDPGDRYPEIALAAVAALHPDAILLPSEPYPFAARHAEEIRATFPGVVASFVDGRDLFWWGIRTPAAIARLRGIDDRGTDG